MHYWAEPRVSQLLADLQAYVLMTNSSFPRLLVRVSLA